MHLIFRMSGRCRTERDILRDIVTYHDVSSFISDSTVFWPVLNASVDIPLLPEHPWSSSKRPLR